MTECNTCGFQFGSVICFSSYNNSHVINVCSECYWILKKRFGWIYLTYQIMKNLLTHKSKKCPLNGAIISV